MADTNESIEWQVCLKEAGETVRTLTERITGQGLTPEQMGARIVACAAEIWAWRKRLSLDRPDYPPSGDPGPQEAPYDPDEAPPADPRFKPHSAAPDCRCGAVMEYSPATETRSAAYFCPDQVKSREKRIQDEQKILHPPVWIKDQ